MTKRQKRIDPVDFSSELPALIGKKVNVIEKSGAAHWVLLHEMENDNLIFYSMRNNAHKKDKFKMPLQNIAEIIIDYPDDSGKENPEGNG